ncbi:hypothetical protein ACROYT_G038611 [Oculina patagonica]
MATLLPADSVERATQSKEVSSEVFMPKDTLDQPCDVILVVEDGKQFKAHRQVLSEASPFFTKLLNSDMKEFKEGVVRLEMFSESVVGNTLEFIYTDNVQIVTEDNARDLIVIADYLFLQNIKSFAEGFLLQKLNTSNCISFYYFSETYQCRELFSKTTKFIHANFSTVCAASREEILNMSSKQVQMWISSDEINVTAEEDVFKIILAWINHDKSKRKKYFAELFRHVRLVYVSRDFLCSAVTSRQMTSYDLNKNQWEKIADIKIARRCADGAAANGNIYIAGGIKQMEGHEWECEVFNETTNEWQFIPRSDIHPRSIPKLLSVDDKLYVLAAQTLTMYDETLYNRPVPLQRKVKCYDPDKKEWSQKTEIPSKMNHIINSCSMRIFKGFLDYDEEKEDTRETASPSVHSSCALSSSRLQAMNRKQASMNERRQRKCFIL